VFALKVERHLDPALDTKSCAVGNVMKVVAGVVGWIDVDGGIVDKVLGSISSTFNEQPLCAPIPKVQKDTVKLNVFFVLLGSEHVKALGKMLMKLNPENQIFILLTLPK
jgi:hypothetical protein